MPNPFEADREVAPERGSLHAPARRDHGHVAAKSLGDGN
ncbi:hypothetical protein ABIB26_002981 [Arthrobacter sp. UYEF20]